jgi:hypothetical protein
MRYTTEADPASMMAEPAVVDANVDAEKDDEDTPAVLPSLPSPNFSCQYRLSPPSSEVMADVNEVAVGRRVCSSSDRWKGLVVMVVVAVSAMISENYTPEREA